MAKIRNAFNVFAAEDVDLTPVRLDPAGDDVFQEYIVPFGIKKLQLEVVAAKGFNGANGGKVECILNVRPKQKLFVYAGRMGVSADESIYNASDIRTSDEGVTDETSLQNRLVVAGAGGAYSWGYAAGPGGGLTGGQGGWDIITTGFPGTQTEGGAPSRNNRGTIQGTPNWGEGGTFGLGGKGPHVGGSGWYGGGSGGIAYARKAGEQRSGGGGGSSYTDPELCTEVVHTQGSNDSDGYVIITPLK